MITLQFQKRTMGKADQSALLLHDRKNIERKDSSYSERCCQAQLSSHCNSDSDTVAGVCHAPTGRISAVAPFHGAKAPCYIPEPLRGFQCRKAAESYSLGIHPQE